MNNSKIKAILSLFQIRTLRWPDPELSIGKFLSDMEGKNKCWEAEGPAKEAFERVKPEIKQLFEERSVEVPSSSFILFDIYMIGETQLTAVPYIMFSCKHRESRKKAVTIVEESSVLQKCPLEIRLGDWDYAPHVKDPRFLASSVEEC
ncbi:hypothetical protein Aspvir_004962 [Aspergillus viridinutans]|uniref:Uncharacterized protein n=1 Tax=Aspergillus viridinutans TaxID=75553 RepID=A0A9P3BWN4_ASPVI|nr:uncharacterized protein Aspvir_004962 [Aspergillus viridinutans]GIK00932.1 hypothetical protein Aspvir_004962 [Aspergillus viridinutans]